VALDRARVVKAAIDLLDEVGLDGLTLRRLAKVLGVQAPALYWHFKSKQELLDQMIATIAASQAPIRPPERGESWDAWLADQARAMHAALDSHRDGALLAAMTRPQQSQWADIEARIAILVDAGMTPGGALEAMLAIRSYVSGFSLEQQAGRERRGVAEPAEETVTDGADAATPIGASSLGGSSVGRSSTDGGGPTAAPPRVDSATSINRPAFDGYPNLSEAVREIGDPQSDRSFEAGLAVILDGLRQRVRTSA
jgi:TetR/AcrR family transcriptional regulator, tetracycline repressor protein